MTRIVIRVSVEVFANCGALCSARYALRHVGCAFAPSEHTKRIQFYAIPRGGYGLGVVGTLLS